MAVYLQFGMAVLDRSTGEFFFQATPPERTEAELESLFSWYRENKDHLTPSAVAAIFFAEFQAIHPFHDGNGRVGRLLNLIVLKKLGFENIALVPLDGRFFRTQEKYYEALRATNDGKNWGPWARYFSKELERGYEIANDRADLRPLIEKHSRPSVRKILEWVLARDGSEFSHGDYPNPDHYSAPAISAALAQLVDEKVLEPAGEKRGRRYKLATPFLKKIYGGEFLNASS